MSRTENDHEKATGRGDTLGALVKGLAIIEMFGLGRLRLTVAEAAKGTGITRAAARRCLLTLEELGYLAHDGKFFTPTPRLRRLGGRPRAGESLAKRAQPHLEALRDQFNESFSIAVLDGGDSLFIARAEAEQIVSTGVKVGRRLPAYCSATGRVLLGGMNEDEIRSLLADVERVERTAHTITDVDALVSVIRQAHREGFCFSDEELEIGMRSLAVPIHDDQGECVAAISVSVSAPRIPLKQMRETLLPAVLEHAKALSGLPVSG